MTTTLNARQSAMFAEIAARGDRGIVFDEITREGPWMRQTARALQRRGLIWSAHDRRLPDGRIVRCDHPDACPIPPATCYRGEHAGNHRYVLTHAGADAALAERRGA